MGRVKTKTVKKVCVRRRRAGRAGSAKPPSALRALLDGADCLGWALRLAAAGAAQRAELAREGGRLQPPPRAARAAPGRARLAVRRRRAPPSVGVS